MKIVNDQTEKIGICPPVRIKIYKKKTYQLYQSNNNKVKCDHKNVHLFVYTHGETNKQDSSTNLQQAKPIPDKIKTIKKLTL